MHKERKQILDFLEIDKLLISPLETIKHVTKTLTNGLGVFNTTYIHDSGEFMIREYSFEYKRDYNLTFSTEEVRFIEISFFLNAITIRDTINGQKNEYLPYHAYIYYTPENADVEIHFEKENDYRNLDIYIPLSFFNEWTRHDETVEEFTTKIAHNQYAQLFAEGIPITAEVAVILSDIKKCTLEGISREYFIKSKVHHLLSLLFKTHEQSEAASKALPSRDLRLDDIQTLEDIKEFITVNSDKFHTIEYLAKEFGMNEFKLKKGFKKMYGKGLFEYTAKIRMTRAIELIRNTDFSLKEIAFKIGYTAPSSFSVAFKKEFGMSPTHFR